MTKTQFRTAFIAAILMTGGSIVAAQEPPAEDHEVHHEEEPAVAPDSAEGSAEDMADAPSGMMPMMQPEMMGQMPEMMSPELMQMMRQMPGMMSPEMMQMMMGMMMARQGGSDQPMAAMPCPMMSAAAGMGPGGGMMAGQDMIYGSGAAPAEMTPDRVRALLERQLEWHGNPRLQLGEIATATDGSITAEILTVDGSLVQKLAFNRYPGLYRQVDE